MGWRLVEVCVPKAVRHGRTAQGRAKGAQTVKYPFNLPDLSLQLKVL